MSKRCPKCGSEVSNASSIMLSLGIKRKCSSCKTVMAKSQLWTFAISCLTVVFGLVVFAGAINVLGLDGFIVAGVLTPVFFFAASYFVPLTVR